MIARCLRWVVAQFQAPPATHELLQIHLRAGDQVQVAQRRFEIAATIGERMAWLNEVLGKTTLTRPSTVVIREGDPRFVPMPADDCGPCFVGRPA